MLSLSDEIDCVVLGIEVRMTSGVTRSIVSKAEHVASLLNISPVGCMYEGM